MAAITINSESSHQSKISSDIDFYRRFYTIRSNDDLKTPVRIVSPKLSVYDKYRYVLLRDSNVRQLSQQYWYRPDYVSYEEYNTVNYWPVLLYINDIPSIEEFTKDEIIVPTLAALDRISFETEKSRPDIEVVPIDVRDLSNTIPLYTSKLPEGSIDTRSINENVVDITPNIGYMLDTFTLKSSDILNRYVDLQYPAVFESVKLIIAGHDNCLYNIHYALVRGYNNQYNRVTWDPRKLSGPGLMHVMHENLVFSVSYVKRDS